MKSETKLLIGRADVYIHLRDIGFKHNHHLDIEFNLLDKIIGEQKTCCGSSGCGLWVGLTKEQAVRATELFEKIKSGKRIAEELMETERLLG